MRLGDERESANIEDRRGMPGGGLVGGGIGTIVVVLAALYFGVDPSIVLDLLNGGGGPAQVREAPRQPGPGGQSDPQRRFVAQVLAETEDTWSALFQRQGLAYADPHLVLFSGATGSACGHAQAAVGPFYCPGDRRVYLDLAFFDELSHRFGAPGDFARAYVIAHEVGHHVQNLLGVMDRVNAARERAGSQAEANRLSVRLELQADCFAGVWAAQANRARHILEKGDIEQGLAAASAVGDDRLQMQARGYVVPESFTHGSSADRVRWFRHGLDAGEIQACDTFRGR